MFDNPLKIPIHSILKQLPGGLSEYDLIDQLQERGACFPEGDAPYELVLFQKHFMVMNALYQLQERLLDEEDVFLSISPLLIRIEPSVVRSDNTFPAGHSDSKLREYYLDWDNFEQTTHSDVNTLLDDFWKRYFSIEKRLDALATLGLDEEVDWASIQQTYRRLAAIHHPDKGGDQSRFVTIKEAYEVLSYCYK